MTPNERQLARIPNEAPRGPQRWKWLLQVTLTLCVCILVVVFGLNPQLMGMLLGAMYLVLFFVTSLAGFAVFMVVGFVLVVRAMRQNPIFRRGNLGYSRPFVWGSRLALAGLAPLAVGCLGFFWYYPSLLDGWIQLNDEFVGFFALLGAALVLFCIGIALLCVAFIWTIWQRIRSVIRSTSGNSNA
jgi:hypothetical protein